MLILLAIPWKWARDINIVRRKINLESEKNVPVHIWETSRFERAAKWMWNSSRYNKIWKWTQEVCYRVPCQGISHLTVQRNILLTKAAQGLFVHPVA